jgi:integrase
LGVHGTSPVSLNAAITGLKFFFDVTLAQGELMAKMDPVRVPRTLPVVLSRDEAARLIGAARNLKHQTALSVAYGAGLRASEVVALKVGDSDSVLSNNSNEPYSRVGMSSIRPLLSLLLMVAAGWVNRHQLIIIEFLQAENQRLKQRLRRKRIRFTDDGLPRTSTPCKTRSTRSVPSISSASFSMCSTSTATICMVVRSANDARRWSACSTDMKGTACA